MAFWSDKQKIIEPVRPYRFRIQNAASTGDPSYWWWAKSISKPSFEISKEEYLLINHNIKYPGILNWKDVTIKIIDYKQDGGTKLYKLYEFIKESKYSFDQSKDGIAKENIIMNIIIEQLDADGTGIEKWTLKNAFIVSLDNTDLSYEDETLSEITIVIAYDEAVIETTT